jgi:hypothetical protein
MSSPPENIPSSDYSSLEESRYRTDLSRFIDGMQSKIVQIENGSLSTFSNSVRRSTIHYVPVGRVRIS